MAIILFSDLAKTLSAFDTKTLTPFPAFNPKPFRDLLDEEMGYI